MSRKTTIASAFVDLVDGASTRAASPDNVWLHACMMCSCNAGPRRSPGPARWIDRRVARLPIAPRLMKASRVGIRPSSSSGVMCFPIGRVPADQENFSLVSFFNHGETTRWKLSAACSLGTIPVLHTKQAAGGLV